MKIRIVSRHFSTFLYFIRQPILLGEEISVFRCVLKYSPEHVCGQFLPNFPWPQGKPYRRRKNFHGLETRYNPVENFFYGFTVYQESSIVAFDQISIIYCPIVRFHIYLAILIIRNKIFHLCISSYLLVVTSFLPFRFTHPASVCVTLRRGVTGCHSEGVPTTRMCVPYTFPFNHPPYFIPPLTSYVSFQSVASIGHVVVNR